MFSRHLIAAAALMAATCAAHADAITTTTTISDTSVASGMSIVDTSTALTGASTGLAGILAAPNTSSQLVLVRGVEGLYMLASRATAQVDASTTAATTTALLPTTSGDTAALTGTTPVTNAIVPVVNAADVPEPATLALMLAGVLGVASFTRARKQG